MQDKPAPQTGVLYSTTETHIHHPAPPAAAPLSAHHGAQDADAPSAPHDPAPYPGGRQASASTIERPGIERGRTPPPAHWRPDPAMEHWQDELIGAVTTSPSEREVFSYIQSACRGLGFDHVSYGFQAPLPLSRPRLIWHNDYPERWQRHYTDMGYPSVDPRIIRARSSEEPFLWNAALFADVPELWADMISYGLSWGWTQSTLNEPGGISMLSLVRCTPLATHELRERLPHMQWLALVAHKAFSRVIRARLASDAPALTQRELEVLRWTADGKSAQDIAEILLLSKNTVDFHIRNSIMKLDAPNKTAAVVRAVLLGLFQ